MYTGCPFHPRIIDPSQVTVIGDTSNWTGMDRLRVNVGEMQTMQFDARNAGPGKSANSLIHSCNTLLNLRQQHQ